MTAVRPRLLVPLLALAAAAALPAAAPAAKPSTHLPKAKWTAAGRSVGAPLPTTFQPPQIFPDHPELENPAAEEFRQRYEDGDFRGHPARTIHVEHSGGARAAAGPHLHTGPGFTGLDGRQCQCNPSDVVVAASPTDVLELVNTAGRIWRRGGQIRRTFALSDVVGGSDLSDPQVIYDPQTKRWFASALDIQTRAVRVAVSVTSDPTGQWLQSTFQDRTACPDQPRMGVSPLAVTITVEEFSPAGCRGAAATVEGGVILLIDKQLLMTPGVKDSFDARGPSEDFTNLVPADAQTATPGNDAFIATATTPQADQLSVLEYRGRPGLGGDFVGADAVGITELDTPPDGRQKGSHAGIGTGDNRLQSMVFQNGKLYITANDMCRIGGGFFACVRVIETTAVPLRLIGEQPIALQGLHTYYPAARPDANGNIVTVFGASGRTLYPSVFAVAFKAPLRRFGQVTPSTPAVPLVLGTNPNNSGRWGDYYGVGRDPSRPRLLWVAGQVGDSEGRSNVDWGTHVDAVSVFGGVTGAALPHQVDGGRFYRGRTAQNRRITVVPSGDGSRVSRVNLVIGLNCRDGTHDLLTATVTSRAGARIVRQGTFTFRRPLAADPVIRGGSLTIAGTFTRHRVRGTVSGSEANRGHGVCSVGRRGYSART